MKSPLNLVQTLAFVFASLFAIAGRSPAQAPSNVDSSSIVVDYSADTLLNGASVSSWTPFSGSNPEAATTANATATGGATYHAPTVANTGSIFNGHQYVSFISSSSSFEGLATANDLGLTGATNMSLATVYATTSTPKVSESAGLANLAGGSDAWFTLQDRTTGVTGDPYLAGFGNDVNSGGSPSGESGVLTFALATYTANTTTANVTLYWAYGLTGAVQSTSSTISLDHTTSDNFELGYDGQDFTTAHNGSSIELGQAIAYNSALSSADATTEIEDLQSFYASVPEPSAWALMGLGAGLLLWRLRRHSTAI